MLLRIARRLLPLLVLHDCSGSFADDEKPVGLPIENLLTGEVLARRLQSKEAREEVASVIVQSKEDSAFEHRGEEETEEEEAELEEEEEDRIMKDPSNLTGACMLLGGVAFIMSLFYLVHHSDRDIRYHSWNVISKTVCIFVAVLLFSGWVGVLELIQDYGLDNYTGLNEHQKAVMRIIVAYVNCATFYAGVHCVEASFMGQAIPEGGTLERELSMVGWGTLLAHVSAFSLIRCIALVQHLDTFGIRESPSLSMLCVVANAFMIFWVFRGADAMRSSAINERGRGSLDRWDEILEDIENDIAQIALSFSTVVALRFHICGTLSNLEGVEEPTQEHSAHGITMLFIVGLLCALLGAFIITSKKHWLPEATDREDDLQDEAPFVGLAPWDVYIKRWVLIIANVSATIFSVSAMFSIKWTLHRTLLHGGYASNPNSCLQRVVLALLTSFGSFLLVYFLDMLADLDATGEDADHAILCLINSIAILVGFSWERSFDAGVEVISEYMAADFAGYQAGMKMFLAIAIACIMVPAWRSHLLKKTLAAKPCICGAYVTSDARYCHTCGRPLVIDRDLDTLELEASNTFASTTDGLLPPTPVVKQTRITL